MEGNGLLGLPTFTELENGRFKCAETGQEVLHRDKESYSGSKRCRLGLIDHALSHQIPPLNFFKQDPLCRSKLICKLTGNAVNKNEQHIWKHVNGKRFLKILEQKRREEKPAEKQTGNSVTRKDAPEKTLSDIISEIRNHDSDSEESNFWVPPGEELLDFESGSDGESRMADDENAENSEELSARTKRLSIEVGPSSFASRKKKSKNDTK